MQWEITVMCEEDDVWERQMKWSSLPMVILNKKKEKRGKKSKL